MKILNTRFLFYVFLLYLLSSCAVQIKPTYEIRTKVLKECEKWDRKFVATCMDGLSMAESTYQYALSTIDYKFKNIEDCSYAIYSLHFDICEQYCKKQYGVIQNRACCEGVKRYSEELGELCK